MSGDAPQAWYPRRPRSQREWDARVREVASTVSASWLTDLAPAFDATGAARDRLERVARDRGVVVTTGQQPGLFGGPIYTWSKALSALELADAIERATGVSTAPVFWAATDDADFAEAASTWVALAGGAQQLRMPRVAEDALPMAETPLGDVSEQLALLATAARSAIDPAALDAARRAYHSAATVGGAYLALLRSLFQPLGIAVIDASHQALLAAERPMLVRALERAPEIAIALAERTAALRQAGHAPQVADVDGLSIVFSRTSAKGGVRGKVRVPIADANSFVARAAATGLSPNVLLRPVVERAVLPTVAYVAGPGELAYFAQVSAVADSLGAERPLAVARWSCTIIEPQVETLLGRYRVTREELATPHQVEGRLARAALAPELMNDLTHMREQISATSAAIRARLANDSLVDPRVVEGVERQMTWRADHLEQRLVAAAKRRESDTMRDIATLRGALYPGGTRQERALNFLPLLARNGRALVTAMRDAAREHAESLVERAPATRPSA
ncbi:MAG: bacillithiol biosynthesis cysteine-adding enzyme BshC [Gemmatimonadaceae bacterium]